jgi:DNA-binding protein H-NS
MRYLTIYVSALECDKMASQKLDVSTLSLVDLRALSEQISVEIAKRADSEKKALLSEFESRAKASGFTLSELLTEAEGKKPAKKTGKGKGGTVAPKYRNPQNSSETWTGRGRFPAWVKALKDAGGDLDSCLIAPVGS